MGASTRFAAAGLSPAPASAAIDPFLSFSDDDDFLARDRRVQHPAGTYAATWRAWCRRAVFDWANIRRIEWGNVAVWIATFHYIPIVACALLLTMNCMFVVAAMVLLPDVQFDPSQAAIPQMIAAAVSALNTTMEAASSGAAAAAAAVAESSLLTSSSAAFSASAAGAAAANAAAHAAASIDMLALRQSVTEAFVERALASRAAVGYVRAAVRYMMLLGVMSVGYRVVTTVLDACVDSCRIVLHPTTGQRVTFYALYTEVEQVLLRRQRRSVLGLAAAALAIGVWFVAIAVRKAELHTRPMFLAAVVVVSLETLWIAYQAARFYLKERRMFHHEQQQQSSDASGSGTGVGMDYENELLARAAWLPAPAVPPPPASPLTALPLKFESLTAAEGTAAAAPSTTAASTTLVAPPARSAFRRSAVETRLPRRPEGAGSDTPASGAEDVGALSSGVATPQLQHLVRPIPVRTSSSGAFRGGAGGRTVGLATPPPPLRPMAVARDDMLLSERFATWWARKVSKVRRRSFAMIFVMSLFCGACAGFTVGLAALCEGLAYASFTHLTVLFAARCTILLHEVCEAAVVIASRRAVWWGAIACLVAPMTLMVVDNSMHYGAAALFVLPFMVFSVVLCARHYRDFARHDARRANEGLKPTGTGRLLWGILWRVLVMVSPRRQVSYPHPSLSRVTRMATRVVLTIFLTLLTFLGSWVALQEEWHNDRPSVRLDPNPQERITRITRPATATPSAANADSQLWSDALEIRTSGVVLSLNATAVGARGAPTRRGATAGSGAVGRHEGLCQRRWFDDLHTGDFAFFSTLAYSAVGSERFDTLLSFYRAHRVGATEWEVVEDPEAQVLAPLGEMLQRRLATTSASPAPSTREKRNVSLESHVDDDEVKVEDGDPRHQGDMPEEEQDDGQRRQREAEELRELKELWKWAASTPTGQNSHHNLMPKLIHLRRWRRQWHPDGRKMYDHVIAVRGTDTGFASDFWQNVLVFADVFLFQQLSYVVPFVGFLQPDSVSDLLAAANVFTRRLTETYYYHTQVVNYLRALHLLGGAADRYAVTGHSLGGVVAQLAGVATVTPTIVFSSPGVRLMRGKFDLPADLTESLITNVVASNDPVPLIGQLNGEVHHIRCEYGSALLCHMVELQLWRQLEMCYAFRAVTRATPHLEVLPSTLDSYAGAALTWVRGAMGAGTGERQGTLSTARAFWRRVRARGGLD